MRTPVLVVATGLLVCSIADAKKSRPRDTANSRVASVDEPSVARRAASEPALLARMLAVVDDEPMSLRVLETPPNAAPREGGARGLDDARLMTASAMRSPAV